MLKGLGINGKPDSEQKRCFDCQHCQAAVNWWCVNKGAIEYRGTRFPGVINCPYWEGIVTEEELLKNASWFSKILGSYKNGYIEIDLSNNKRPDGGCEVI